MSWTCPDCSRLFARRDQPHSCRPSNVRTALLAVKPALRPLVEKLLAIAGSLAHTRVESASGSFMVKAPATFCSIRPRARDIQVSFILPEEVSGFPISKTLRLSRHGVAHAVHVDALEDIDERLRGWIIAAHDRCTRRGRR